MRSVFGSLKMGLPLAESTNMHIIRPIDRMPEGFDRFLYELVRGYGEIYGEEASRTYASRAESALNAILAQPESSGFAAFDKGKNLAGICIGSRHGDRARIDFIHLLGEFAGSGMEQSLVQRIIEELESDAPEWISIEVIPLCRLRIRETLESLGFRRIERALMAKAIGADVPEATGLTISVDNVQSTEIVTLIREAFAEQDLEVPTPGFGTREEVHALLRNYAAGEFGPHRAEWARATYDDGAITGIILGSAQLVDTGFIFQLAVSPEHQRQGLGAALMFDLEREYCLLGMRRLMLGVTLSAPAYRWYESLGFEVVRPVRVYHRHRGWIPKSL